MFITNQSIVEASFYYGQLYRDTLTAILLVLWALWTHHNDIVLNWALPKAAVVLRKVQDEPAGRRHGSYLPMVW